MTLLQEYKTLIDQGALKVDPEQRKAVMALNKLVAVLKKQKGLFKKKPAKQGVYLYGGVGRGKSMLMDLFFDHVERDQKERIHFHEFMIRTHDALHAAQKDTSGKGVDDLLPRYAKTLAKKTKLLCFDEFHVTNITDAMLLSRLFTILFEQGVFVVATSNWAPDDLYKDGLQRSSFLPFIDLFKERMEIIHLDSPHDYRQEVLIENPTYFYPLSSTTKKEIDSLFDRLSNHQKPQLQILNVKKRQLPIMATTNNIARCSFSDLCEKPLGAEDYITLAKHFHTVFIEDIPKLRYDRRNEAKRFILLIDALYEAGTHVIFSADASPDKLSFGHDHSFEFDRTLSRINEMQSKDYLQKH